MGRHRSILIQLGLLVGLFALAFFFGWNTYQNLTKRGIASGFEFLGHPAGFDIIFSLIEYSESDTYLVAFFVGLLNTLLVSILGIGVATVLGFFVGVCRLSSHRLVAGLAESYVEISRNVPLLLQIFFWYFAVLRTLPSPRQSLNFFDAVFLNIRGFYLPTPDFSWLSFSLLCGALFGPLFIWLKLRNGPQQKKLPWVLPLIFVVLLGGSMVSTPWDVPALRGFNFSGGFVLIPELVALLVALSIYTAGYIAEIVRAGIQAVHKGQREAALALGLSGPQTMVYVVLPQSLKLIIPPLTSQYLNLTKNSSLAAAIAYPDLVSVFASTVLNHTGQAIEIIGMTMGVYLTISLSISYAMNLYNRRILRTEGGRD